MPIPFCLFISSSFLGGALERCFRNVFVRRKWVFLIVALCCVSSSTYSLIPPDRPLKVNVEFKGMSESSGILIVSFASREVIGMATLTFIMPRGVTIASQEKGVDRKDNVYTFRVDSKESRAYEFRVAVEGAGPYQFEVKGESRPQANTVNQHNRKFVFVKDRRSLQLLTPDRFMRMQRMEAEKRIQEGQQKDSGYNLNDALGGKAETLSAEKMREVQGMKFDDQIPMVAPAPREEWEKGYYRDVPQHEKMDPITVRGTISFRDIDGSLRPFVNASVYIMDDDFGPDEQVATTITDWSGRFSVSVNNNDGWFQDGRDIYVEIKTTNSRFRVQDESYWPDWTYTWRINDGDNLNDGAVVDFGSRWLVDYQGAAIIFQKMNDAWNHFTTTGGQDPGFIDGSYPTGSTHYDPFWGEVNITGDDDDSRDIIVHEYGHGLMDNAQSFDTWSGAAHSFCQLTTTGQAFDEGWATFAMLQVYPDNRFNWEATDTGRELEQYSCAGSQSNANGPRDEGRVVAALLDLTDASNDSLFGCTSVGDRNSANRVPLRTIWRDAMWGSFGITVNSITGFWSRLCPRLTAAQRTLATEIMNFNCVNVSECDPEPLYVAQQASETERRRNNLKMAEIEFRKLESGRHLVDFYYENEETLTRASNRDGAMKGMARTIVDRLVRLSGALMDARQAQDKEVLFDREFVASFKAFLTKASQGKDEPAMKLRNDIDRLYLERLLSSFEDRSVAEIRMKFSGMKHREGK